MMRSIRRGRLAFRLGTPAVAVIACLLAGCGGGGGGGGAGLRVDTVTPDSGDVAGGRTITIEGRGFDSDTTVDIGGQPLGNIQIFNKGRELTGTTPPAPGPGPADVVVRNAKTTVTLPGGFTYFEAVSLASITPNFGPVWGGTSVDVVGTGFIPGTSVTIGGNELQNLQVVNNTLIRGFSPPGSGGGQVDVAATNQNGADVITNGFEYFSPVIIFTVTPNAGPTAGGTSITIRGTGFTPDSQVKIEDKALVNLVVLNIAEITGETPPGDTFGPADVTVSNSSGGFTFDDGFTYFDQVSVVAVDPPGGPVSGAIPIAILGTGFVSGSTASIGANPVQNIVVVDDSTIMGTLPPAGSAGVQDVLVTTPFGSDTLVGGFEYFDSLGVSGITPNSWYTEGGLPVTISGAGFFPGTTVEIGGSALLNPSVIGTSAIVGAVPPGVVGPSDVVVTNVNGSSTLPGAFLYISPVFEFFSSGRNWISEVVLDPSGGMWVGTQGGGLIYVDDNGTPADPTDDSFQTFDTSDGMAVDYVSNITLGPGNAVWIATGHTRWGGYEAGVNVLDTGGTPLDKSDDGWTLYDTGNSLLPHDFVHDIFVEPVGIWMGLDDVGLAFLDHGGTIVPDDKTDDQWVIRTEADGLYRNRINVVFRGSSGYLQLGLGTNIYQALDDGGFPLDKASDTWGDSLLLPSTPLLFEPHPGGPGQFWLGGSYRGLMFYDDNDTPLNWFDDADTNFDQNDGLLADEVPGVVVDGTAGVFAGTTVGLSYLNHGGTIIPDNKGDDTWTSFLVADGLAYDRITSMARESSVDFWIGTEKGMSYFDHGGTPENKGDDNWVTYFFELPASVSAVAGDPVLGTWFGTESGLAHLDDKGTLADRLDDQWTYFTTVDGLADNRVYFVYPEPSGTGVWALGEEISYLDHGGTIANKADDTWETLAPPFSPVSANGMIVTPAGGKWISTWNSGALYLDDNGTPGDGTDDTWVTYSTSDGLVSNSVRDFTLDPSGGLWFATSGGASYLDHRGTLDDKFDDLWAGFTAFDGLADTNVRGVEIAPAGGVWFGTVSGLSHLDHNGTPLFKSDDDWTVYTAADGLGSNSIRTMMLDSGGLLWFGFGYVDGLTFLNASGTPKVKNDDFWGRLDTTDGLDVTSVEVTGIVETSQGYWIGVFTCAMECGASVYFFPR